MTPTTSAQLRAGGMSAAGTEPVIVTDFDEYGTPLCPMTRTERGYDDAADTTVYREVPCHEELRLTVRLSICPGKGDPDVPSDTFVNENANTSSWEYGCFEGHILATSCEEENAEDFTWLSVHMAVSDGT